jgi:MYXO-CTERM domain-containing protein
MLISMEPVRLAGCRRGMRRSLAVILLAGLCLAPSAAAKGPHAILSPGTEPIEPGRAWAGSVTFVEFGPGHARSARPFVVARNGDARVSAPLRSAGAGQFGSEYRLRLVIPEAGRWRITVVDGSRADRRFVFPALAVGGPNARPTSDFVAFPKGSRAERAGAGGTYGAPSEPAGTGRSTPLPPKVISFAEPNTDGGTPFWIPAAGLALAGLGLIAVRRRRTS